MNAPSAGSALDMAGSVGSAGANFQQGLQFAQQMPQNLIVRQEVNLGLVRELVPPQNHIGLQFAPWLSVASDDVVFDYIRDAASGLAPARAEDAESQLWMDDEFYSGKGRASVIDWALKNYYTSSDVTRFRELQRVIEMTEGQGGSFPLTVNSITEGFAARVTRDTIKRKARLDNRIEWLIMTALSTGRIAYNDGRIKFDVNFNRPSGQHNQAPASGTYASDTHDPINDILAVQQLMYDTHSVTPRKAIVSRKYLNSLYKSSKFRVLTGFAPGTLTAADMPYALPGWGPNAAIETVKAETGLQFIESDNVLRTRAIGSNTFVNTRYFPENQVIFLPDESELGVFDETEIGFAKTLTSPHPMGNWQTGFYAWEQETTDPWGHAIGTGVKAFPVFPHMNKTYTWELTL